MKSRYDTTRIVVVDVFFPQLRSKLRLCANDTLRECINVNMHYIEFDSFHKPYVINQHPFHADFFIYNTSKS